MSDNVPNELQEYLDEKGISELFVTMVERLLINKPENPIQFMVEHLFSSFPTLASVPRSVREASGMTAAPSHPRTTSDELGLPEPDNEIPASNKPRQPYKRGRRTSVSAEAVNPDQLNQPKYEKKTYDKPPATRERIRGMIANNILFNHLDGKATETILDAFFPMTKYNGDIIIRQGDEGDNFYIVDSGIVEIYKDGEKVMTCTESMSFGELALMYNAPRAATVQAAAETTLWALDRLTFKMLLMDTTIKQRSMYVGFLAQVPILESLTDYERLQAADALSPQNYREGEVIIRQGDDGDVFYIIEEGEAVCTKTTSDGAQEVVGRLSSGAYFGEIALMSSRPRQATVTAATDLTVLQMDRKTFVRVMGPLEDIMKRKMEGYGI